MTLLHLHGNKESTSLQKKYTAPPHDGSMKEFLAIQFVQKINQWKRTSSILQTTLHQFNGGIEDIVACLKSFALLSFEVGMTAGCSWRPNPVLESSLLDVISLFTLSGPPATASFGSAMTKVRRDPGSCYFEIKLNPGEKKEASSNLAHQIWATFHEIWLANEEKKTVESTTMIWTSSHLEGGN